MRLFGHQYLQINAYKTGKRYVQTKINAEVGEILVFSAKFTMEEITVTETQRLSENLKGSKQPRLQI